DRGYGDRIALTGPLGVVTYAELCAEASRWGHALISLGLKRGDRVLMFLDDTPAYPAAFFGAVRAGFVPLLINTLTPPDLLQFYLSDSGAAVAVADAGFWRRFDAVAGMDTSFCSTTWPIANRPSRATCSSSGRTISVFPCQRSFSPTVLATPLRSLFQL